MIKKYMKQLIISSAVILLPIVIGLILWNALPGRFATHWGIDGQADGWSGKALTVFASPLSCLVCHWLCVLVTAADPKNKAQHKKAAGMIFWVCPLVSLFSSAIIFGVALGARFNMASVTFALLGVMFAAIGNYLPKVKPNYTIGIKTVWALHNEENWHATHRFGGKLWVAGGIAMLLLSFLPAKISALPMVLIIIIMTLGSVLYSWLYYKKQCRAGVAFDTEVTPMDKTNSMILKGTLIYIAIVCIFVGFLLFSGSIEYTFEETGFTIDPSYWDGIRVDYAEITSLELRSGNVSGSRVWGLGSFRLLLGRFENGEFGNYTRYTYYDPDACVIVTCGEKVLVLSGADAAETSAIYETLNANLNR